MDQITKTESGENIYYIAKINFNGQEYTGKFIHDNANEKDVPFVAGSVFGNGSVLVLIIMFFLAVFTTIAVIAAKKKKKIITASCRRDAGIHNAGFVSERSINISTIILYICMYKEGEKMGNKNLIRQVTDKVFGGLNMSWLLVILLAVGSAVLTAVFLIVPVFENTSFHRMGELFEAWILFAVIIMSNCKKPLESALKTFVFFLISQPLIYLLQVPFSQMGWQLFGYYKYWLIWTILTFPMAFVGWYIQRKNLVSLLILSPVLFYLTSCYLESFRFTFRHFPLMLVTGVFCLAQTILYLYAFTPKLWQRLAGFFVPFALILTAMLIIPRLSFSGNEFLPDSPVLTDAAVVETEDNDFVEISIDQTGEDSMVRIIANDYGTADFTVKDGGKDYHYSIEIYEDNGGHPQTRIVLKEMANNEK